MESVVWEERLTNAIRSKQISNFMIRMDVIRHSKKYPPIQTKWEKVADIPNGTISPMFQQPNRTMSCHPLAPMTSID